MKSFRLGQQAQGKGEKDDGSCHERFHAVILGNLERRKQASLPPLLRMFENQ
jgi:hypothetical protein